MARQLLRAGFPDGAVFHAYHAYECTVSALIAAHGYAVPPEGWTKLISPTGKTIQAYPSPGGGIPEKSAHKARLVFFHELADRTKPYFATHAVLSRFMTLSDRMDALYYNAHRGQLPHQRYSRAFATGLLPDVLKFAQEVWQEIR
jgi:hypothetical protein